MTERYSFAKAAKRCRARSPLPDKGAARLLSKLVATNFAFTAKPSKNDEPQGIAARQRAESAYSQPYEKRSAISG